MPSWEANSSGGLRMVWGSPDDFFQYLSGVIAPTAMQYGYRIVIEAIPKEEPRVDRA